MSGRRIGDFEGCTLVGTFDPDPATCSHQARPFGLIMDCTYVWGTFRDEDGNPTSAVRRIATAGDTTGLTMLHSPHPRSDSRIVAEVGANAFIGRARPAIGEREVRFVGGKAYTHGDRGFEFIMTASDLHWAEANFIDLSGRIVGPGLQFLTPWPDGAVMYTSRLWYVQGSVRGAAVNGFMGVDNVFVPPGYSWGHEPVSDTYELSWYTWGNRYDDGTLEVGHIAKGHGYWGFALVNNDAGELTRSTAVASSVDRRDEAGWPLHITYQVDGEPWEWVADDRGRMPDMGSPGQRRTPNSEGQFRRVGEPRRITTWMAWGETVPANGDVSRPAPPI